jgi:hypothetical protein
MMTNTLFCLFVAVTNFARGPETCPGAWANVSVGVDLAPIIAQGWLPYIEPTPPAGYHVDQWSTPYRTADNTCTRTPLVTRTLAQKAADDAAEAAASAASQAAAEAARKATPVVFDQPIQSPSIETKATDGHIYSIKVDPADGEVFATQRESLRTTDAEDHATTTNRIAARAARRANLAALRTTIQDIDPAAFPAGPERQTIRALKDALQEVRRILAKE